MAQATKNRVLQLVLLLGMDNDGPTRINDSSAVRRLCSTTCHSRLHEPDHNYRRLLETGDR